MSSSRILKSKSNLEDLKQRATDESEVKSVNERYKSVIASLEEGIVIHNIDGEIITCNESAERILGLSFEQMSGTKSVDPIWRCIHEDGSQFPGETHPAGITLKTGRALSHVIMGVYKCDGSLSWISINSQPLIREGESIPYGVVATFNDITNQKQYENELISAKETAEKANEMKDEFLSIISHEFKTPITVISSAVQAMEFLCRDELSERAKGFLKNILQNSNRQLKLVNNLLDITRINAGHFIINKINCDIVILTRKITESICIYAERKNIRISFFSDLKEKVIGIDEENYERIILNLLSNAVKFTPCGKSISVILSEELLTNRQMVCIQIKDEGIGIPEDKQDLIFERFGQVNNSLSRQAEGTGIGLSLVKMLIDMMEGRIFLKSSLGKGSTFSVYIPDEKVKESTANSYNGNLINDRLVQTKTIEFSDVDV